MDFGIARLPLSELTLDSVLIGSPCYIAPESGLGREYVDHRSDLFSLGVLAYELLAGFRPFDGDSVPEIVSLICHRQPDSLAVINPALPDSLVAIVEQLLTKAPAGRPRTAAGVRNSLEQCLEEMTAAASTAGSALAGFAR
jgi:serine/threonine-protein kinase